MTNPRESAMAYLTRPGDGLWRWSNSGEVIQWSPGSVIVFREELREILLPFAARGLPSFNALLILLAACRGNWSHERERLRSDLLLRTVGRSLLPDELDSLQTLSRDLRSSTVCKRAIASIVLETAPRVTSPAVAAEVLDLLAGPIPEALIRGTGPDVTIKELLREFAPLREGVARVTAEAIELRMQTGLDQLVAPAKVTDESVPSVAELLSRLENDEELAGLARLARNLMAVVHLPRPLADPDHLPLGGVSDITNRGTLDRLLLSELAHDDDTLLTRIALNEAMYIRREAPPRSPPTTRALLLDAGLRMWGLPRVFATATALSFAAVGERQLDVRAWRAAGPQAVPVDLRTRQGLITHLAALEATLHPGEALAKFLRQAAEVHDAVEPVLLVPDEVLADAEFQRALATEAPPLVYIAAVNRRGRLQLLARTARGTRLLREADLDLERLLAPPEKRAPTVPLVDKRQALDLPAIFSLPEFPLLLYAPVDYDRAWHVEGCGVFTVTHDRRLLLWEKPGQGGRQIAENIPAGKRIWHSHRPTDGIARAILHRSGSRTATYVRYYFHATNRRCSVATLELSDPNVLHACERDGVLMVICDRKADAFEPHTGMKVATCETGRLRHWLSGRYFRHEFHIDALGYNGRELTWQLVPDVKPHELVGLFERPGTDGPVGLFRNGAIVEISSGRTLISAGARPFHVLRVSASGDRLIFLRYKPGETIRVAVDLIERRFETIASPSLPNQRFLQPEIDRIVRPMPLRKRFVGIGDCGAGTLVLTAENDHHCAIDLSGAEPWPRLVLLPPEGNSKVMRKWKPFRRVRGAPYRLRRADFNDGSAAYLDARGLLHLKSSNPKIPEMTFVLAESMACWSPCKEGIHGNPALTGDPQNSLETRQFFAVSVERFLAELR